MKLKLYELQEREEARLQAFDTKSKPIIATALAISEFGLIYTLAKSILEEYGIVEHPEENTIDHIKEKELLVKMFIAGNARVLHDYDPFTLDTVLCKDYNVSLLLNNQ